MIPRVVVRARRRIASLVDVVRVRGVIVIHAVAAAAVDLFAVAVAAAAVVGRLRALRAAGCVGEAIGQSNVLPV